MGYLDIISWFFFLPVKFYYLFLTMSKVFLGSITNLTLSTYFLFRSLIRFIFFLSSWDFLSWVLALTYLVVYVGLFYLYSSILGLTLLTFRYMGSSATGLTTYLETPIKMCVFFKSLFRSADLNGSKTLYYRLKR